MALAPALEGFGPTLNAYSCLFLSEIVRLLADADPHSRALHETLLALQRLSCRVSLLPVFNELVPILLRILTGHRELEDDTQEQQHVIMQLFITLACQVPTS